MNKRTLICPCLQNYISISHDRHSRVKSEIFLLWKEILSLAASLACLCTHTQSGGRPSSSFIDSAILPFKGTHEIFVWTFWTSCFVREMTTRRKKFRIDWIVEMMMWLPGKRHDTYFPSFFPPETPPAWIIHILFAAWIWCMAARASLKSAARMQAASCIWVQRELTFDFLPNKWGFAS